MKYYRPVDSDHAEFELKFRDRFYHLSVLDQSELQQRLKHVEAQFNWRYESNYNTESLESARSAILKYLLERQTLEFDRS